MAKDHLIHKPTDPDYWEWRKKTGRPKALKSPKQLWQLACEYFERTIDNPIIKLDFIRGGENAGELVKMPTARPFTWAGLEAYLFERSIIGRLEDYKANTDGNYEEFSEVIHAIDKIMYSQKFEGAAAGIFHHAIIARDLGLTEKIENRHTVETPLFGDAEDDNEETEEGNTES